jgi:DNA-binding beta-propeller fold protein YncE
MNVPRLVTCAALALAFAYSSGSRGGESAPPNPAICDADGEVRFICVPQRPEDLLPVPDTNWVVTSSIAAAGGIYLIDVRDNTSTRLFPSADAKERLDRRIYDSCPGPLDADSVTKFVTAGIALRRMGRGKYQLYAVHFGKVSSIQVFELVARRKLPSITRVGCVIAPEGLWLNSIAPLPEGGFVATNFLSLGPEAVAMRARVMAGEVSTRVWEWHTGRGWSKVPNTEASGANGVAVSPDGRWIYLSAWGSQSYLRIERGGRTPVRDEIPLGFRPDNFHLTHDGMLLGAGQVDSGRTRVVMIDPHSLQVTQLLDRPDVPTFGHGTAAIVVGDKIWVGTSRNQRIVLFPAPGGLH